MKLTPEQVNPKLNPKYSPNFYKFLKKQTLWRRERLQFFRTKQDILWVGYIDDEGWFLGTRLACILCSDGRGTTSLAHYSPLRRKLLGIATRPDKKFEADYLRIGQCAFDPSHNTYFPGEHSSRWVYFGETRHCMWCGDYVQERTKVYKSTVEEIWEKINA